MDEYKSLFSGFISGGIHTIVGYPFDTIKTLKQSNVQYKNKNLFKGLTYPLLLNSCMNSIMFGSNNFLKKYNNENLSNLYSGIISSIISTPFDKYKIMRQYNLKYDNNIKNILYSFKNTHIVSMREIPAIFIYFKTYQECKNNNIPIFLSGSLAGFNSWLFTYPIDTIKTRLQNETCKTIKQAYIKGNLFNGLTICLIRSFIVNGVNFSVYEEIMKL